MNSTIPQRIDSIRAWLSSNNYDALIIPHEDEYLGEYLPEHNERLYWATGFTGSAGAAVITKHNAAIFVDGRYTVQVRNQVPSELFEYRHLIEEPYLNWLNEHVDNVTTVAFDSRFHSAAWLLKATQQLNSTINLVELEKNPIDALWLDRPAAQLSDVRLMDISLVGQSSVDKREQIAAKLKSQNVHAAILTQLDSICWLLNIRGLDVSRLPVLLSHAIIYSDSSVSLYLSPDRIPANFNDHVGPNVTVLEPSQLPLDIQQLSGKAVLFDSASSNAWFKLALEKCGADIIEGSDPCALLKAQKNATEVEGMKACHVKDGVAMVKFLRWLDSEVDNGQLHDEAVLADKLQSFREEDEDLVDLSFDTISAAGANAAMCHYNHINQDVPGTLAMNSLYLVDSGGQYINGTTDITRTIAIGQPSDEMIKQFTLVLKGHISLSNALFPKGTTGSQLDILARQHLWANGFDYDHGTGHGVGHFLSVHEGPARISKVPNSVALLAGMVLSNEPGYYRAEDASDHGEGFGIRIENLELVVEKDTQGDFTALGFESLTLCPIDKRNIDTNMLTKPELAWLNRYHSRVWETLSPLLGDEEKSWLKQATCPLLHNEL